MLLPFTAKAQGSLANIPGLWLTGVDGAGNQLDAVGATDPHYRIVSRQPYSYPIGTTGSVVPYGLSGWFVPSSGCWIWFDTAASSRDVIYTFRLTFDLTGFDHTTASISGKATADDFLDITLNGTAIGSYADFVRLHSFSATSGFVAGVNHLDFAVTGTGYADGLLVDELSGTAVRVPEPSSAVLLAAPLFALAVLARRKRTP